MFVRDGADPPLLLLHGFPSSSFDWRGLLAALRTGPRSPSTSSASGSREKPRDHVYTLAWQADLTEELVTSTYRAPGLLVAHDMGTSVATELLARDLEGRLGFELAGAVLFNGSIVLDRATLTAAQRLLRGPLGPLRPGSATSGRSAARSPACSPRPTRSPTRRRPTSGR